MLGSNLNIMSPQWTDIIFKNRNQEYGAYQLRKQNASNTNRALIIAASAFVFVLALPTIINWVQNFIPKADVPVNPIEVKLYPPPPIEQTKVIPPPPVQERQVRSLHDVIRFPPPVVRPDVEAHEDPPTETQVAKADLGQENIKGSKDGTIAIDENVGPADVKGVTESTNNDAPFVAVEVQPTFPGGEGAFGKFLTDHIRYPAVAKENGVTGRVFLQFIVERDGSLTDMKIIRDPGSGLGEEAARVLKISPHWKPGIQNGKPVRVQFTVPVNFSLSE